MVLELIWLVVVLELVAEAPSLAASTIFRTRPTAFNVMVSTTPFQRCGRAVTERHFCAAPTRIATRYTLSVNNSSQAARSSYW